MTEEQSIAIEIIAKRAHFVRGGGLNEQGVVPSPCISVCKMDEARQYCKGCWRTLDELRAWSTLDNAGKREVWAQVEQRIAAVATA